MNPITSEQLKPVTQTQLPTNNDLPQTTLDTFVQPTISEQQTFDTAKKNESDSFQALSDALLGGSTIESQTLKEERKAKIDKQRQDLTDIDNEINQKSLAFRREQERITSQPGLTIGQRNALLTDVSRKQNSELADLEVIKMARSNNLNNAESAIQKKVQAQFAEQERKIKALEFVYNRAEGQFKDEVAKVAKKEERAYNLAKDKFQTLEQEKLQLVRNAQANGAGNGVLSSILKSETLEDAYRNAGSYGMSLEAELMRLNIKSKSLDIKEQQKKLEAVSNPYSDLNIKPNFQTATYAKRISDAENSLQGLTQEQLLTYKFSSSKVGSVVPNLALPEDVQKFKQAERNFINSVLRRESGANITSEEFANARQQYIPQPGDTEETLTQKTRNREVVKQGLILESGGAYEYLSNEIDINNPDSILKSFDQTITEEESSQDFYSKF